MRNFENVSNETLQNKIEFLAKQECSTLAEFLEHLVECSERKLFLELGYNSLFDYLRRGLGYSESCAQKRSQACGLVKRLPGVLKFVADGVHLSALNTLSAALTAENFDSVLSQAKPRARRMTNFFGFLSAFAQKQKFQKTAFASLKKNSLLKAKRNKRASVRLFKRIP